MQQLPALPDRSQTWNQPPLWGHMNDINFCHNVVVIYKVVFIRRHDLDHLWFNRLHLNLIKQYENRLSNIYKKFGRRVALRAGSHLCVGIRGVQWGPLYKENASSISYHIFWKVITKQHGAGKWALDLPSNLANLNPKYATYELCDLGQIPYLSKP